MKLFTNGAKEEEVWHKNLKLINELLTNRSVLMTGTNCGINKDTLCLLNEGKEVICIPEKNRAEPKLVVNVHAFTLSIKHFLSNFRR